MKTPKILVIGDLMIDQYAFGSEGKSNPESNTPLYSVNKIQLKAGGAANVANGLHKLGSQVTLCGVISPVMYQELAHLDTSLCHVSSEITSKTRLYNGDINIFRCDYDIINTYDFTRNLKDLSNYDLIVISDYAKGVCTKEVCQLAIASGVRVIVDPKGDDYSKYDGAFLVKPNAKELTDNTKWAKSNYTFVTNGGDMAIISGSGILGHCNPCFANVKDVTGAGDTVMATLAYMLATGKSVIEACELSMKAAAISIEHIGNYNPTLQEIYDRANN